MVRYVKILNQDVHIRALRVLPVVDLAFILDLFMLL